AGCDDNRLPAARTIPPKSVEHRYRERPETGGTAGKERTPQAVRRGRRYVTVWQCENSSCVTLYCTPRRVRNFESLVLTSFIFHLFQFEGRVGSRHYVRFVLLKVCAPPERLEEEAERLQLKLELKRGGFRPFARTIRNEFILSSERSSRF